MIELYWWLAGLILVAWTLTGGADLGAGLWDLVARGPRADAHRRLIEHTIAPIWEANHIWLIFLVVLLFAVFPVAYAVIGTALHIPITIALVGIVLRGSAFVFRSYGLGAVGSDRLWGRLFAVSSLLTPIALGLAVGGLASGDIHLQDQVVTSGFLAGWTTPFALSVGILALALFALLAAVYLAVAADGEVRADFIRRALAMEVIGFVAAATALFLARDGAPQLFENLLGSPWSVALQVATALSAIAVLVSLRRGSMQLARVAVAAQVGGVVIGFGLAMDGHIVMDAVPIHAAGAHPALLGPLGVALLVGAALTIPSLIALFRVFGRQ